jgi:hypothetical protein
MKWTRNEILVGFVSGLLGILVGAGLMYWGRLPDHTIDLLVFTESAFGIGMTVIALVFSLVTVNQVKEIERRFAEKSTEIDTRFSVQEREVGEDVAKAIQRLRTVNDKIEGLFSQLRSDLNDKIDKTFIDVRDTTLHQVLHGTEYSVQQVEDRLSKRIDEQDALIESLRQLIQVSSPLKSDDNA